MCDLKWVVGGVCLSVSALMHSDTKLLTIALFEIIVLL